MFRLTLTRTKSVIKSPLSLGTEIMNESDESLYVYIYDAKNKYSNGQRCLRYIVTEHDKKKIINPTAF